MSAPAVPARAAASMVQADLGYILESLEAELEVLEGSRLLITGGAGFLGYYMIQSVLSWNDLAGISPVDLVVVDNFMRGTPPWLADYANRPDLTLITHDVRQPPPASLGPFDYVIHAAGIASPHVYRRHPIETMDANVYGLRFLLDASVRQTEQGHPVSGFLFYSSSEIYGDPPDQAIPTPETYRGNVSSTGPRACYDESKRFGETLSVSFASVHGLAVTIARPFNNYGPGMKINDGRVIADFCRAVVENRDIVMYSDGSPTRTFCYVADAVVGYYKVLTRGRPGEPYNIGADRPEVSMLDLAGIVAEAGSELFGYQGRVVPGISSDQNYLVDNPSRRCPDLTKTRTELGYLPGVDLEDGVRRTLTWYRANSGVVEE
jgi:dTDP-glucose 4,6-dehydratase/UDP-glucuronate decarboxylase